MSIIAAAADYCSRDDAGVYDGSPRCYADDMGVPELIACAEALLDGDIVTAQEKAKEAMDIVKKVEKKYSFVMNED